MSSDFTVTVAGPERHEFHKPYSYVVTALDEWDASEKVLSHFKAEQTTDDVILVSVEPGVPALHCGFTWNDIR